MNVIKSLSRSSSQNSLNEGERSVSPVPIMRNAERMNFIATDPIESTELDPALAASIQFTQEHPIGAILIKLASDNTALARKANLRGVETNINDLCTSFHTATILDKNSLENELARSHKELEYNLIAKDLNSHTINNAVKPPQFFSETPTLTSTAKLLEIQKILPRNIKFSGARTDNMSVVEFLNTLTEAQHQLVLTEMEFINRMIICSTGLAHELITEWRNNGENVETIYHNLLINFDNRLTPEDAKTQLSNFKIPKASSLAKAESQIMILASRTASALPEGPSRTIYYNLEACNSLIRALPPHSSSTTNNLYNQISARLGRAATFAELSRGLNLYRTTIDKDIKQHGGENHLNNKRTPHIGKIRQVRTRYTAYSVNAQPCRNYDSQQFEAVEGNVHPRTARTNASAYSNSTSFTPRPIMLKQLYNSTGQDKTYINKGNNKSHMSHNKTHLGHNKTTHGPKLVQRPHMKRDRQGKFQKSNSGCSLCGIPTHLAKNCNNMQNDSGRKIDILPTYGTCSRCPSGVHPRLHHPEALCPFRVGGPLRGKNFST